MADPTSSTCILDSCNHGTSLSYSPVNPMDSGGSITGMLTRVCFHTAARKCERFMWNVNALLGVCD